MLMSKRSFQGVFGGDRAYRTGSERTQEIPISSKHLAEHIPQRRVRTRRGGRPTEPTSSRVPQEPEPAADDTGQPGQGVEKSATSGQGRPLPDGYDEQGDESKSDGDQPKGESHRHHLRKPTRRSPERYHRWLHRLRSFSTKPSTWVDLEAQNNAARSL
jgi:hypothetical protein